VDKERTVTNRTLQVLVIGVFALVLAVGVGAGLASGGLTGSQDTFLNDVAARLHVTPDQLKAAIKGAYDDRIDVAVSQGKLTKEQADALKKRAEQGTPFFGPGFRGVHLRFGGPGRLGGAAAKALGLTPAELRQEPQSGKTLAQIAKDKGKSVADLEKAMTADVKASLDKAVRNGLLTQAQADALLKQYTDHLDDLVNGKLRAPGDGPGFGHGPGRGGFPGMPGGAQPQGRKGEGAFAPIPA
jgi:hypothetical protein